MKTLLKRSAILMVLLCVGYATGASAQQYRQTAYRMARFETRENITMNDEIVQKFAKLLTELADRYTENGNVIGSLTYKARQTLQKEDINESQLTIMDGMLQLVAQHSEKIKYSDYISSYVGLRSEGQSHEVAMKELAGMLEGSGAEKNE